MPPTRPGAAAECGQANCVSAGLKQSPGQILALVAYHKLCCTTHATGTPLNMTVLRHSAVCVPHVPVWPAGQLLVGPSAPPCRSAAHRAALAPPSCWPAGHCTHRRDATATRTRRLGSEFAHTSTSGSMATSAQPAGAQQPMILCIVSSRQHIRTGQNLHVHLVLEQLGQLLLQSPDGTPQLLQLHVFGLDLHRQPV